MNGKAIQVGDSNSGALPDIVTSAPTQHSLFLGEGFNRDVTEIYHSQLLSFDNSHLFLTCRQGMRI